VGSCSIQIWKRWPLLIFSVAFCCLEMPFYGCSCKTLLYELQLFFVATRPIKVFDWLIDWSIDWLNSIYNPICRNVGHKISHQHCREPEKYILRMWGALNLCGVIPPKSLNSPKSGRGLEPPSSRPLKIFPPLDRLPLFQIWWLYVKRHEMKQISPLSLGGSPFGWSIRKNWLLPYTCYTSVLCRCIQRHSTDKSNCIIVGRAIWCQKSVPSRGRLSTRYGWSKSIGFHIGLQSQSRSKKKLKIRPELKKF